MPLCLVTGGAGFIGSHLVAALVARGHEVRVLDNFSTGRNVNLDEVRDQIEVVEGDITDLDQIDAAMEDVDLVFHQAALASVPRSIAVPLATHAACATGTLNVLQAARQWGVRRVVYAASSSAYGAAARLPKRETDLPQPLSPYAVAKLVGEHYCAAFTEVYGLETVRLRYFNVYGPGQSPDSPYAAVTTTRRSFWRQAARRCLAATLPRRWLLTSGPRRSKAVCLTFDDGPDPRHTAGMATLVQIPLHRFAIVCWLNARLVRWSLRWRQWRQGIREPIAWFMIPHVHSVRTAERRTDWSVAPGLQDGECSRATGS